MTQPEIPRLSDLVPTHWVENFIEANGIRQHYYRTGKESGDYSERPKLVMLHGFMSLGLSWLRVAFDLEGAPESGFEIILPDARGHGQSGLDSAGYSIELVGQDTAELLRILHLQQMRLVGHSNGALASAWLAANHPNLVNRVVLVEPPMQRDSRADTTSPQFQTWRRNWLAWMEAFKAMTYEQQVQSYLAHQPPGLPAPSGAALALEVEATARFNLDLVRDPAPTYPTLDVATVARIACPILLITGSPERGGVMNSRVVEELTSLPNLRHVPMEESGHVPQADQPELFVTVVRDFLEE